MSALPLDPEAPWRFWKQEAQNKLLSMLETGAVKKWRPFYCPNFRCNGQPHVWPTDTRECPWRYGHEWERDREDTNEVVLRNRAAVCIHCGVKGALLDEWTFPHARTDQRPPKWTGDWLTLLIRSGRGSGKTLSGSQITNRVAMSGKVQSITLIGATGPDIRNTMVERDSGILATAPPDRKPEWEPSKKQLTWPNGCVALGFSAEEPDRLRGQNAGYAWLDEPAHYALIDNVWKNMMYGLRKGQHPKIVATSTPKSTKWVKGMIADPNTIDRRVSSWANLTNLSPAFRKQLEAEAGSRFARQEIDGEVFDDVQGALWQWDYITNVEMDQVPELVTTVVSIDPAGSANKRSDETGIVVLGMGVDKKVYVLADYTGKYSPEEWARRAIQASIRYAADRIVYEKNYGGDMVRRTLETEIDSRSGFVAPRLVPVDSRRGKELRAEPIVAKYEKSLVLHVGARGNLAKLEEEMTMWVPGVGASPNRVDALVHGATNLFGGGGSWDIAVPT